MKKSSYTKLNDKYKALRGFVKDFFVVFDNIKNIEELSKLEDGYLVGRELTRIREEGEPTYPVNIGIHSVPQRIQELREVILKNYLGPQGFNGILRELETRANALINYSGPSLINEDS